MHKSKLKKTKNKKRADVNFANYKKLQNFCVTLLRRTKKDHFQNLNAKDLSDNKNFWKIFTPYFSNKRLNSNKMLLKEKGGFVSDGKQLASVMNKFFINITKSLNLKEDQGSPPVILEDIQNLFFIQVLVRLENFMKTIKSFLSTSNRRTRMASYFKY